VIVYGRNPVRELLRGPRLTSHIWATTGAARESWLRGAAVTLADGEEIEQRCGSPAHQGICAATEPFRYASGEQVLAARAGLIVALDQVQDPQNLGSICRSAECAGARAVVIPDRRCAEVTAAVCKASAGAVEHLPIARVRNLSDFIHDAKRAGRWCYGADGSARTAYDSIDYGHDAVIVLGAEGRGLRPRVAANCDALIAIPLRGKIESLSVSAAAAILLYAAAGRP
jgi:23S rRNA (guanosine2251-2'-O)-methyltransferase